MSEIEDLMAQIARLAPAKRHNLGKSLVDGSRELALPQARQVLTHLHKCPDIPGVANVEAPAVSGKVRQLPDPADARMPRPAGEPAVRASAQPAGPVTLPRLADLKGIPAGYYATPSGTGTNDLDFWRVDVPKKGKWEGFSFARRILGGGSGTEMRTIDLDNIQQRRALAAIQQAGLDEAGLAFAMAIGRCRKCGLILTDDESRARGMGPTCAAKAS